MSTLLHEFLQAASIPFTDSYAEEVYMTEPKVSNLLGIKRMLLHFGIETKAVRMDNAEDLKELSYPYILHIKDDFVLVKEKADLTENVLKAWDGIALYIFDQSKAQEPDYKKHRNLYLMRKSFYSSLLLLPVLTLVLSGRLCEMNLLFVLLGLIGLVLGILLIQKSLGESSQLGDKVCHLFQKMGCDAVLTSDKAKIFGILSLSEVGLGYFWTQLLLLSISPIAWAALEVIALFGMFFPIWSIYSQARMKRWCGLCLLTIAVLLLQGITVLCFEWTGLGLLIASVSPLAPLFQLALTGLVLLAGILAVHLLTDGINQRKKRLLDEREFRYTMRQADVFQALMQHAEQHEYLPSDVTQALGNPDADYHVAIYLSHTCPHCKVLKPQIDSFVQTQGSKFAVELIYSDHLSSEEEDAFMERTGLTATPTILLNGYKIPFQSELTDLAFVL